MSIFVLFRTIFLQNMEKSRHNKKPQEPHKQRFSGLFKRHEPEGIRTPDTQLRKLGTNGLTMRFLREGVTVGVTVGTKKGGGQKPPSSHLITFLYSLQIARHLSPNFPFTVSPAIFCSFRTAATVFSPYMPSTTKSPSKTQLRTR